MLNPEDLTNKIVEYESFLENTLKSDLNSIQKTLLGYVEKYKEWEEVKQVVKTLKEFNEKDCDLPVRIPLGCGVHVNGAISDYERTYISIGLGIMLEMDCKEADTYSAIRMRSLKKNIEHYRTLAVKVKVNIKMVLLAINELQQSLLTKEKE